MLYEVLLVLHPNFLFNFLSCYFISPSQISLSIPQVNKWSYVKATVHPIPFPWAVLFLSSLANFDSFSRSSITITSSENFF